MAAQKQCGHLPVHKAETALRGDKKTPKAAAHSQNTTVQPSTAPRGLPTQQ